MHQTPNKEIDVVTVPPKCPVCGGTEIDLLRPDCIYIRHMDFQPMLSQPAGLANCSECSAVFMADGDTIKEIQNIYAGVDYARDKKTEHRVHDKRTDESTHTTYRAIADFLGGHYPLDKPRVLDIGCFDGKLLIELERECCGADMHGYDVSPAIEERFPQRENYTFHYGDLGDIPGTFDLICIVNTLMYIEDPADFMNDVDRLLKPEGHLFVLTPNTAINPCFLTLGDQTLYFSPDNLANFLDRFGYAAEIETANASFPRSVLASACRSAPGEVTQVSDMAFSAAVTWLDDNVPRVRAAVTTARATHKNGRVAILGCAHNAAWAFHAVGGNIDCFADENPTRVGTVFYGKPVLHPRDLSADDTLVMPYGATADAIRKKFAAFYRAQLVAV